MDFISQIVRRINLLNYSIHQKNISQSSKIQRLIIPILIVAILFCLFASIISVYFDIAFWRHDAFAHSLKSQYAFNLQHEGRWINHYLFDLIKIVPPQLAALISLLSLISFTFICITKATQDKILALVISISVALLPMVHCQNLWPNITLAALLMLPIIYVTSTKISSPYVVFSISAILCFGTLSMVYFLVPLVFLSKLKKDLTGELKKDLIFLLTQIILPYVFGFLIGYAVSNGIVYLNTGQGMIMSDVRQATPIDGISQLLSNTDKIYDRIIQFSNTFFKTNILLIWLLSALMIGLSWSKKSISIFAIFLIMALSAFITTIYHGIIISDRTLLASGIPLIILFMLIPAFKFNKNIVHLIICLALIFPFYLDSKSQLTEFSNITNYYQKRLENVTQQLNQNYNQNLLIIADINDVRNINNSVIKQFSTERKWGESLSAIDRTLWTGLKSIGYNNVAFLNDDKQSTEVLEQVRSIGGGQDMIIIKLPNPDLLGVVLISDKLNPETVKSL